MSFFFVSSVVHIFLKAYLSFRGKILKLYTFSCSPPHIPCYKKKKLFVCLLQFFFIHIFVLKINGSTDLCLLCSHNTKNMDICYGVFCISINCVKVLNSMLKDYVCQGVCVLD